MTDSPRRRRGRPRGGSSDARERILAAAAAEFGAQGYDATTMRTIAERARVDAALLHHYFGTKAALFTATVDVPADPTQLLPAVIEGDLAAAGERLVRMIVTTWDAPHFRTRGVALLRTAIGSRRAASMLVGFLSREVLGRIGERLGGDDADRRVALVGSQVIGLIVTRYVLELEPLASASVDEVVAAIGPTIQRYLTGDLQEAPPTRDA
ncbi:MAG: TetR family transcriptional regulator [Microbacterium sp.]|uniref:TetR/AcrR family transcriptional regulator n=1 Tax=Microbacterium sp. TaxID=51671 RepID=UPI001AD3F4FE|nr:TetR family transcriptional regulator [Microbacterium sp.]MBN9177519.1 TetR family transcriptional regulator [Microbacterium sp.]